MARKKSRAEKWYDRQRLGYPSYMYTPMERAFKAGYRAGRRKKRRAIRPKSISKVSL